MHEAGDYFHRLQISGDYKELTDDYIPLILLAIAGHERNEPICYVCDGPIPDVLML